jgi:hypothetical protein
MSIQPQGIPLVNERMSLRGSPIIHSMFKNQGELAELYLIPGKRKAYGIVMIIQFADLYGEKKMPKELCLVSLVCTLRHFGTHLKR